VTNTKLYFTCPHQNSINTQRTDALQQNTARLFVTYCITYVHATWEPSISRSCANPKLHNFIDFTRRYNIYIYIYMRVGGTNRQRQRRGENTEANRLSKVMINSICLWEHIIWKFKKLFRACKFKLVNTFLHGQENRSNAEGGGNPLRWPRDTLYPQKLALTSLTSGGPSVGIVRLRTKDHGV
jgi:hypothetical protein